VASVLEAFATGLVFFSAFQLLTRCFYALGDTRTPTAINAVAVAVTTAVNLPLFAWLGVRGLGFGHAIGYATGSLLSAVWLTRRVPGGLRLHELVGPLGRNAAAAAAMGGCVWAIASVVPGGSASVVGVSVGAGAILYLAFSQVAGATERAILLDLVRQWREWRPKGQRSARE
jgi:putative peptidoglycan lipid II flippase